MIQSQKLHELVEEAVKNGLPRVVISVASKDGQVVEAGRGPREWPDSKDQVDGDSMFWLASMTKLVTALAGAQMIERGRFSLDSFADEFVPELKDVRILTGFDQQGQEVLVKPKTRMTIKDLFVHTGGTTFCMNSDIHERYRVKHGIEQVWTGSHGKRTMYTGLPLKCEPGYEFNYAHCTDLLALAVEGASGMDFEAHCKANIFEPIEAFDMVWRRKTEHLARQVNLCLGQPDGTYLGQDVGGVLNPECCSGGGGMFASARSYMKLLRTLLNDGVSPDNGVRIVEKSTIDLMASPQIDNPKHQKEMWACLRADLSPEQTEYDGTRNLGLTVKLMLKDLPGKRRAGTFYGDGYASTYWLCDRKGGVAFVLLTEIAPGMDRRVLDLYDKLERTIYQAEA